MSRSRSSTAVDPFAHDRMIVNDEHANRFMPIASGDSPRACQRHRDGHGRAVVPARFGIVGAAADEPRAILDADQAEAAAARTPHAETAPASATVSRSRPRTRLEPE